jgi:hypothetical protein
MLRIDLSTSALTSKRALRAAGVGGQERKSQCRFAAVSPD